MNKKGLALTLCIFMLFSLLPIGAFADDAKIKVKEKTVTFKVEQRGYKVGDKLVETDAAPYIKDLGNGGGRTMVPVAFVAPALGTEPAVWLPVDRMVMLKKGDNRIYITIGSNELLVNDKKVKMDVAAEIQDLGNGGGRTMLPIAFIAKALEVGYEWDEAARSVYFYGYTETYNQKGIFGPGSGIETIDGSVVVKADGAILQNMVIKGNLIIAEEVGDGDVTLNNIIVKGETYIRGGGKDSIHINGGQYKNITVQNINGKVRVVANDVDNLPVVVSEDAKGDEIILEGSFSSVVIEAEEIKITTQGETVIKEVVVAENAKGSIMTLNSGTVVEKMVLSSQTEVKGKGTIKEADVKAAGVTFEKAPEKQALAPEIEAPTVTTPSVGGGGGGNDPVAEARVVLKNKIAQKLTGNNGALVSVDFGNMDRATITINASGQDVSAIKGTGAMVALFDITEIYAFQVGNENPITIRDGEGKELIGMKQVKDQLIVDMAVATLGQLSGTEPTLKVSAKVNGYNIAQTYYLIFN